VRRVTVLCCKLGRAPKYYTFRKRSSFLEDELFRHVEPATSQQLELRKLENYQINLHPTDTPDIHLYTATERNRKVDPHQCFFVRAVVKHRILESNASEPAGTRPRSGSGARPRSGSLSAPVFEVLVSEVERLLSKSLEAIDVAGSDPRFKAAHGHHVFLNVIHPFVATEQNIESVVLQLGSRHGRRMWRLKVRRVEVIVNVMTTPNAVPLPVRFFVSNPSGHFFRVHVYRHSTENGRVVYRPLPSSLGRGLDGMCSLTITDI
jgi:acetyl-CoA carboxylase / biotin carboxylase 1